MTQNKQKKTTEVPDRISFSSFYSKKIIRGENIASVKREKWEYSFCLFVFSWHVFLNLGLLVGICS